MQHNNSEARFLRTSGQPTCSLMSTSYIAAKRKHGNQSLGQPTCKRNGFQISPEHEGALCEAANTCIDRLSFSIYICGEKEIEMCVCVALIFYTLIYVLLFVM
jgi:hypothetical protein